MPWNKAWPIGETAPAWNYTKLTKILSGDPEFKPSMKLSSFWKPVKRNAAIPMCSVTPYGTMGS
jgi:hypothetical protein